MPDKYLIWCAHPYDDTVLPNGKNFFSKTDRKPSHPKRERSVNEELIEFINNRYEA